MAVDRNKHQRGWSLGEGSPPETTALGAESNEKGKGNDNLEKNSKTSTASSTASDLPANVGVTKVGTTYVPAAAPGSFWRG